MCLGFEVGVASHVSNKGPFIKDVINQFVMFLLIKLICKTGDVKRGGGQNLKKKLMTYFMNGHLTVRMTMSNLSKYALQTRM